jgi:tRNA(fMet)-specific endonuclease VapC
LTTQVERVLDAIEGFPWAPPCDRTYARIRCDLEMRGALIGANDLLIAAHALALGLTLVTANRRDFSRIDSLRTENWLDDRPA